MSKKFKLLALTLACVVTLGTGAINAFASAKTKVSIEDSFNNLAYEGRTDSSKWVTSLADSENASIKQSGSENPALQFVPNLSGGERVQFGTAIKVEDIESVSFSYKMPEGLTNQWFAINFYPEIARTTGGNHYYFPMSINGTYVYVQGASKNGSAVWADLFPEVIADQGFINETWISFKLVPTSETTMDVYVALRAENPEETVFPAEPTLTVEGTRADAQAEYAKDGVTTPISFKSAYVLFGSEGQGHGMLLDDINIVGSNVTIKEDFTSSIMSEEIKAYPENLMGTSLKVMDNNTLEIASAKAGDRIVAKRAIEEDTSIAEGIVMFEATFTVKMAKTCADEIAFVFGLPTVDADPRQDSYAYVIGKDYGKVIKHVDGDIVYETPAEENHDLMQVTSKKGATINIKVYKDGAVDVYENGVLKNRVVGAETYVGFYGFAVLNDTTGVVNLDDVVVKTSSYYVPKTKSVTHNFSNDFFGNEGYEDFYVSTVAGTLRPEDGKLVYNGCSDESMFGSAHQYDSFIMDYQLCSIDVSEGKTEEDRWFGLDVGRSSVNLTKYGSNMMFAFIIVPRVGVNEIYVFSYQNENSSVDKNSIKIIHHQPIPASYFRDIQYDNVSKTEAEVRDSDAVCIRWVSDATNENLKLYMKKASEAEFTLYTEIKGINTSGYQALCVTGWTSLKIDNFSMSNTSPIYEIVTNEAPETIYADPIIKEVFNKNNVDVNWEEEVNLLGSANVGNGEGSSSGCKGSVAGSLCALPLALIGAWFIRRKNR